MYAFYFLMLIIFVIAWGVAMLLLLPMGDDIKFVVKKYLDLLNKEKKDE